MANVQPDKSPAYVLPYQRPGTGKRDRTRHVWYEVGEGDAQRHKCVICGGVVFKGGSKQPSDHADCDTYEPLTLAERVMCPFKG